MPRLHDKSTMKKQKREHSAPHVYLSLADPEDIRLLVLHPAKHQHAPVHISFSEGPLDELEGQYEAISYTWGEARLTHALFLQDGSHICVTKNLDMALWRLRYGNKPRLLWADAACINQNDINEKNSQIPLTMHVFRNASKVVVWLGSGGATEQLGMKARERMSRNRRRVASEDDSRAPTSLEIDAVMTFLGLPWFSRLWVVQEVVFNLDIVLNYGTSELSWTRFETGLQRFRLYLDMDPRALAAVELMSTFRKQYYQQGSSCEHGCSITSDNSIMTLLEIFADHACTDPRDHIIALYSMAEDIKPADEKPSPNYVPFDINYDRDVRWTFQDFATASLMKWHESHGSASGNVLSSALARQFSPIDIEWPSWVPDWRKRPLSQELLSLHYSIRRFTSDDGIDVELLHTQWDAWERSRAGTQKPWHEGLPYVVTKPKLVDRTFEALCIMYQNAAASVGVHTPDGKHPVRLFQVLMDVFPRSSWLQPSHYKDYTESWTLPEASHIIEQALEYGTFFIASIGESFALGYGNRDMEPGDELVLHGCTERGTQLDMIVTYPALIIRRVSRATEESTAWLSDSYRLVGTASLIGPALDAVVFGEERRPEYRPLTIHLV